MQRITYLSMLVAMLGALYVPFVEAVPAKVVFWHIWSPGSSQGNVLAGGIDEFNRQWEGRIQVEHQVVDFWTFEEKYMVAIAAGVGPDVVQWDTPSSAIRAAKGLLLDLGPYMQRDRIDPKWFWPSSVEAGKWQGKQYSLPFNTDNRVFYFNRDHLAEAGLDAQKPPRSWDDLRTAAKRTTRRAGGGEFERVGFNPTWGNVWFLPWLHTNGGGWFDADGNATINRAENLETLEWVVSWLHEYGKPDLDAFAAANANTDMFTSGKLSMVVHTNGYANESIERHNPDLGYGIGFIPWRKASASWAAGFSVEIPKSTNHPDQAWEFLKYITGSQFMASWTRTRQLGARINEALRAYPNDKSWQVVAEQMLTSYYRPESFELPTWWNVTWRYIEKSQDLELAPQAALEQAQQEVQSQIAAARKALSYKQE